MRTQRTSPYIWAKSICPLLVGEDSCEWGAWFKAHYQDYDRAPSTFDEATWTMDHTDLLQKIREGLLSEGYTISMEGQNSFRMRSEKSGIVLAGRPDIVAIKDGTALIVDAKTGKPHTSDTVQVMTYMWATRFTMPQCRNKTLHGRVVYKDHDLDVPFSSVNPNFHTRLTGLIARIGGHQPPPRTPSPTECGFCHIARSECPEKVEGQVQETVADF